MKDIYKGYSIEPSYTIYSPKLQIVNINDCDDFVRYADTLEEAKILINEILEEKMLEMLKKVLEVNKLHNFNGHLINEQIEKIIKQATEL